MKLSVLFLLALPTATWAAAPADDATQRSLDACLAAPGGASTAGQTQCEVTAQQSYDRRMNRAYTQLMRKLPPAAAARLRAAQRAWIAFRDADEAARSALYETRQGTMYVPMQAAASARIVCDRALELEGLLQVMTIDD
ncbi:lysozyme inhibitor LprI family protein [Novosphingobium sp. 9U]|uniref:lysozyme inhibitor LprI family protein n=1 Tax=Novosphingobium sp. 9U TaxID=2653158 RepID=UPI0012F301A8|nr:lysozyme inhibitor LprI family protein [Novosphingobium sp. 9U]VWX55129.1 conserved exported hypothetical protein [Novosphingobium sp. 9U]